MNNHPTDRIKRRVLFVAVALALAIHDLWQVRAWAVEARAIERDVRLRAARMENDLTDHHMERVAELKAEIDQLRANGFAPVEADAGKPVEADVEPVEADGGEPTAGEG